MRLVGRHHHRAGLLHHRPGYRVVLTADFEFDLPARFDTDRMEITIETYELGSWGQIPVVELRI